MTDECVPLAELPFGFVILAALFACVHYALSQRFRQATGDEVAAQGDRAFGHGVGLPLMWRADSIPLRDDEDISGPRRKLGTPFEDHRGISELIPGPAADSLDILTDRKTP